MNTSPSTPGTPTASVEPAAGRARRIIWLLPIASLIVSALLLTTALRDNGPLISIRFDETHGLRKGDPVLYRGVAVGRVREIRLAATADHVHVRARLTRNGAPLARSGTQFWIVRPRIDLTGVSGVDTIIGPKSIGLLPGPDDAPLIHEFIGRDSPPATSGSSCDNLEIVLHAHTLASIRSGSPVQYRQVRVGTVVSTALTSDGGAVEIRAHVFNEYRNLIRTGTRFWTQGGVRADLGWRGLSLEIGTLTELITDSIAFATPPPDPDNQPVQSGHFFTLEERADPAWIAWQPAASIGSTLLPDGLSVPSPIRVTMSWRTGTIIRRSRSRSGFVLPVAHGWIGPADLLSPDPRARDAHIEASGASFSGQIAETSANTRLAFVPDRDHALLPWPIDRLRAIPVPFTPEDCVIIIGEGTAPRPLSASSITTHESGWISGALSALPADLHGAPVLSRRDGALVGFVLLTADQPRIELLTPEFLSAATGEGIP